MITYVTDIEHPPGNPLKEVSNLARNSDLLIHEAHFTPTDLPNFKNYGSIVFFEFDDDFIFFITHLNLRAQQCFIQLSLKKHATLFSLPKHTFFKFNYLIIQTRKMSTQKFSTNAFTITHPGPINRKSRFKFLEGSVSAINFET